MVSLAKKIDILKHVLIPKHKILTKKEALAILEQFNVSLVQLPRVKLKDPVVKALGAKVNDIVEIKREGPSGEYLYYRRVIE